MSSEAKENTYPDSEIERVRRHVAELRKKIQEIQAITASVETQIDAAGL